MSHPARHTPQRQLVLRIVKASARPRSAAEIFRIARRTDRRIGVATVYRNLDRLAARGEIFDYEDGRKRFVGFASHHGAFRCTSCGEVVPFMVGELPRAVARSLVGRTVFFSRLDVRGFCAACAKRRARPRSLRRR